MEYWIKCSDKLPDLFQRVLVYRQNYTGDQDDKVHVGFLQHKDGFYGSQWGLLDDELYPHTLVTHWMPLPSLPDKK